MSRSTTKVKLIEDAWFSFTSEGGQLVTHLLPKGLEIEIPWRWIYDQSPAAAKMTEVKP